MASDGRVMFLDDDDDLRQVFADFAGVMGRDCLPIESYDDLLAHRSDVLGCERAILDVNLGEGRPSGIDAYRWLRSQGFERPIVFLTGHASTHPLVAEARRLGDAQVIPKPASPEALLAVLGWNGGH